MEEKSTAMLWPCERCVAYIFLCGTVVYVGAKHVAVGLLKRLM